MFEATGPEVPEEGAVEGVAGRSWETNGAWEERDWSGVPVVTPSDDPPAGWGDDATWLDEVENPEHGPVAWFDDLAPSWRLMNELESLPADLIDTDMDAVEMVAHWTRLESYCAMRKRRSAAALSRRTAMAEGLARLDGLGVKTHEPNIASDELSLRLGIGSRAAQTLVRTGRAFDGVAIPTCAALEAGAIDAAKADLIVAGIEDLGPDAALEVQDRLLRKASHLPSGRLRRELAAARAAVDPDHFDERCKSAAAARRVDQPRVLPDGMASLYAVLPAVEAIQLYRAVDSTARSAKATGDERTLDQLRADALALMGASAIDNGWIGACPRAHVAEGASEPATESLPSLAGSLPRTAQVPPPEEGTSRPSEAGRREAGKREAGKPERPQRERERGGAPPGPVEPEHGNPGLAGSERDRAMRVGEIGGRSAHVRVVVPLTTMMGGEGGPGEDLDGADDPAQLEGYGPIPASVARALAAGGPWARMVTDPVDRTVLEVSRDRYEPTAAMAELVRARDPECVHLTCGASSDGCDLHHRVPWPIGPTSVGNVDPGCRRHHVLVTHGGWTYTVDGRGRRTWTTPTGLTYIEEPDGAITLRRPGRLPLPMLPDDGEPPPY